MDKAKLEEVQKWLKIAQRPCAPRFKAARQDAYRMVTSLVPDLIERLERAEADRDEARKENDFMRLRLAESDKACVYCELPRADMGACASGFPGCARADDLYHCDELTRRDAQHRREGAADWRDGVIARAEGRRGALVTIPVSKLKAEAKRLREGGE